MLRLLQVLMATLVVLFLAGLFLPTEWSVARSAQFAAEPTQIYAKLSQLRRWPEWTAWNRSIDPSAVWSFSGPEQGAGAELRWNGDEERMNAGRLWITEAQPESGIRYQLELGKGYVTEGAVRFERTGAGTNVTWITGGEFPGGPLAGWLRLFVGGMWDEQLGADFDASLARLGAWVESGELPALEAAPQPRAALVAPAGS